ncbi:unnamed protein product [Mytilus edulis]|uniref:DDE-1 domain-containing protein n=1 Tax=Mytilus edulis TaxID=6550 RepID=A0A8S3QUC9_MYTED|nr:unnamed protein product [Mytilus edulis]
MVPTSEWTLEEKGSKDCSIVALDDKREITGVVGISLTGALLPFQLIYKGTTDRCHPSYTFPKDWNVTHSENHWSTSVTMIEYAKSVLIPYFDKVRKEIKRSGRSKAHALAIFDVFKAHQDKDFLALLHKNRIRTVFVPPSTTEELQPCDRTVNGKLKIISTGIDLPDDIYHCLWLKLLSPVIPVKDPHQEITIRIGSLGIVSLSNNFLRFTDGGDSSCIPKRIKIG